MSVVLVVEDDPATREAITYNLERDGHRVLTAADGVAGLDAAREQRPDLLLLDIMLPRLSGLDVCRMLRTEQSVPILLLTARGAEADIVTGLDLGADDYITKPFSMRELRARVAAALRRDRRPRPEPREGDAPTRRGALAVGGVSLDLDRRTARCDGRDVTLRPREFDLLAYLMRNRGRVLSREQIVAAVWGDAYRGGTRTVDVHIRWLREKLEDDPARPRRIRTARGVGYEFAL
ncbi:MAG: response regulator transcription factor [Chloroflexi bacterium]|nr:response regulator transcription factor [Chloroflexota bacterium]